MRFRSLGLWAIGTNTFREGFEVDLDALDGPLVAFTGPNGIGKTTALESLAAAVYRDCPTRGSLTDLARDRKSRLEVGVTTDRDYTIRHTVDGVSGKSEVLVTCDGEAVLKTTSVTAFDEWVGKHFPAEKVTYASLFAAQGTSGFLGMKDGDRKAVLLRVLGCEELEGRAKECRERALAAKKAFEVASARLKDEEARGASVRQAEIGLEAARAAVEREGAAAVRAREDLAKTRGIAEQHAATLRAIADAEGRRRGIETQIAEGRQRLADHAVRLANNRAILADREAIEAALARLAELPAEEARLRDEGAALDVAISASRAAREAALKDAAAAQERWTRAETRAGRARFRAVGRSVAEAASGALPGLRAEVAAAETWLDGQGAEFQRWLGLATDGAAARIGGLRGALTDVVGLADWQRPGFVEPGIGPAGDRAEAALQADDALAKEAADAPGEVKRIQAAEKKARAMLDAVRARLADAERAAAELDAIGAAERDLAEAEADVQAARAERDAADAAARSSEADYARAAAAKAPHAAALETLAGERARMTERAKNADRLAGAAARVEELGLGMAALEEVVGKHEAALAAIMVPEASPFDVEGALARAEAAAVASVDAGARARSAAEAAATAVEAARAREARIGALAADRAQAEMDYADWTLLAEDCGRDGLQAMLIDCAGPELTTLVNDLLHSCHGPRFTVRIEASKASSDGKETLDGCSVMVLDTVEGRDWAAGKTFSGGERVILGEALSLAFAVLACQRAGLEAPTLVRDETGAALDAENGRAYLRMLRRAAAIVGASKVLFVSHDPGLVELADARVDLAAHAAVWPPAPAAPATSRAA